MNLPLMQPGRTALLDGGSSLPCCLDVYDPTTGEIRSNTTDEIACWFIDSDCNEESFLRCRVVFSRRAS